jgi:GDPmannose 4,6-dehydratase
MYGNADGPCNEQTPLSPASPYGASKMVAHNLVRNYRQRGIYSVGGILFNHESPRRGLEMVTRKITRAAVEWAKGQRATKRNSNSGISKPGETGDSRVTT